MSNKIVSSKFCLKNQLGFQTEQLSLLQNLCLLVRFTALVSYECNVHHF